MSSTCCQVQNFNKKTNKQKQANNIEQESHITSCPVAALVCVVDAVAAAERPWGDGCQSTHGICVNVFDPKLIGKLNEHAASKQPVRQMCSGGRHHYL